MGSRDLEELERELFKEDEDRYESQQKEKMQQRILVANFLESNQQAKVSRLGGEYLSQTSPTSDHN